MGLSAHGHRSQHPGTAPASCLHSHRATNGTATVGPTPLQETQLFGWEPDDLGRVREPVWLNLPVATYLMSQWLSLTSLFAELIPLLIVLGFGFPFLLQSTSTAALTGIGGAALPGANTLLSVSRSAISSLAVAGLVNLVQ